MLIFLWQGIYLVRGNPLEGVFLVPDFQPCIIVFRNNNKLIDIIPGKEKNVGGGKVEFFSSSSSFVGTAQSSAN